MNNLLLKGCDIRLTAQSFRIYAPNFETASVLKASFRKLAGWAKAFGKKDTEIFYPGCRKPYQIPQSLAITPGSEPIKMPLTVKTKPEFSIGQRVFAGTLGVGIVCGVKLRISGEWDYMIRATEMIDDEEVCYSAKEMIALGEKDSHVFEDRWDIEACRVDAQWIFKVCDRETGLRSTSLKLYPTADDACIAAVRMLHREFWDFFGMDNPGR